MFSINPKLILIKLHFFLFFGGLSCTVPYIPVIAKNFGVSASLIGVVTICICLVGLVAKPLCGAIADHFHKHKETLTAVVIVTNILYLVIIFLPPTIHPGLVSLNANVSTDTSPSEVIFNTTASCIETLSFNQSLNAFCDAYEIDDSFNETFILVPKNSTNATNDFVVINSTLKDVIWARYRCQVTVASSHLELCGHPDHFVPIYRTYQFWMFLVLVLFSRAGTVAIVSLSDTAAFDLLRGKVDDYGKQRLWGGVGWGGLSIIGGVIIKMASESDENINYNPGFYLMFIIGVLDVLTLYFIQLENPTAQSSIFNNVGKLLKNAEVLNFLLLVFAIGTLTGLQWNYFYWYINGLGANSLLLGLALCLQCFLGEVPFFFVSGWIIKKVGSLNALTFTFFSFGIRFLFYSYIYNPWWILPVELLEGVTFSLFYSVITSHAKEIAPPGTEATIQGLVGGTFDGLGVAVGALLGGIGFDVVGGRFTFRYASIIGFAYCFLHVSSRVAVFFFRSKKKKSARKDVMMTDVAETSSKLVERF